MPSRRGPASPKEAGKKDVGRKEAGRKDARTAAKSRLRNLLVHPLGKVLLVLSITTGVSGLMVFIYYYSKYAAITEEKLRTGPFTNTSKLFGAPQAVNLGDALDPDEIAASLRRAGYSESRSNRLGWFRVKAEAIEIYPGLDSYFQQEAGLIRFNEGRVTQIVSLRDNTDRGQYLLEPELITNLFDRKREKRRIVHFDAIPKVMVNALLSAEDKRFFMHAGFDPLRIIKSAYIDIKERRIDQGASTLSMQLARSIWLPDQITERTWSRKLPEIFITMHLERKLSKEQIFEHYANSIYLGRVGSFNIHGFGEGAQVFFGKDLSQITLPEAALLAGIIQSPSRFNPIRNPEKARARRNVILLMMRDNGHIDQRQYEQAVNAPLGVSSTGSESEDAPYFVDLVNDQLTTQFQDHDFQGNSYRVYTTLDINLQKAAAEAMRAGLKEVDELLRRRGRTAARGWPPVQAALIAVDPRTGDVKALIGGRDYGQSQLNRALARRQPGSAFKPFVYAAALNTAVDSSGPQPITPTTTVMDEPTTFWYDEKPYEPNNFGDKFYGVVTLRYALSKSLNVPTVKFAERVGYDAVVDVARKAGLDGIRPTPAVALGAYEVKPIDIAGAYTVFANRGIYTEPNWIKMIRDQEGKVIHQYKPKQNRVLDARINYLMVNLLEEVVRTGTGAGIRGRGFGLPAAGKTGTSHDGWFAGFTSELICVVWVGYDDNRELKLEGAKSALPIWTEFMKRAHKFRGYRRAKEFDAPDGVVTVEVDPSSGKLAGNGCSASAKMEVFVAGTQPLENCNGAPVTVASWDLEERPSAPEEAEEDRPSRVARRIEIKTDAEPTPTNPEKPKKRGFFDRLIGVFKR
jgi:penicillin-binding protein 1B